MIAETCKQPGFHSFTDAFFSGLSTVILPQSRNFWNVGICINSRYQTLFFSISNGPGNEATLHKRGNGLVFATQEFNCNKAISQSTCSGFPVDLHLFISQSNYVTWTLCHRLVCCTNGSYQTHFLSREMGCVHTNPLTTCLASNPGFLFRI